jgi:hypothetical protein
MAEFYILPIHASQALGIDPDALDLPRCGYGIDADALWIDPRFIEVRRQRQAVALQLAERRHDIHADLAHKPRTQEEVDAVLKRTRQRRYARKKRQRKAQAKAKQAVTAATTTARLTVAAYAIAHGMMAHTLRQRLRNAGCRAPYRLTDIERVVTPLLLPPG